MTDNTDPQHSKTSTGQDAQTRNEESIPFFYGERIAKVAVSRHSVRFFIYRADVSSQLNSPSEERSSKKIKAVAEIVMPISAFINTTSFFNDKIVGELRKTRPELFSKNTQDEQEEKEEIKNGN